MWETLREAWEERGQGEEGRRAERGGGSGHGAPKVRIKSKSAFAWAEIGSDDVNDVNGGSDTRGKRGWAMGRKVGSVQYEPHTLPSFRQNRSRHTTSYYEVMWQGFFCKSTKISGHCNFLPEDGCTVHV